MNPTASPLTQPAIPPSLCISTSPLQHSPENQILRAINNNPNGEINRKGPTALFFNDVVPGLGQSEIWFQLIHSKKRETQYVEHVWTHFRRLKLNDRVVWACLYWNMFIYVDLVSCSFPHQELCKGLSLGTLFFQRSFLAPVEVMQVFARFDLRIFLGPIFVAYGIFLARSTELRIIILFSHLYFLWMNEMVFNQETLWNHLNTCEK